jgi:hypothetical protein
MASEVCAAGSCETGMGNGVRQCLAECPRTRAYALGGKGEIGIGPDDLVGINYELLSAPQLCKHGIEFGTESA